MIEERIKYFGAFIFYVFRRYSENRCSSIAAELTVTSLLALVPLTAVVFTLLAFIPSFQALGDQLQTLLYEYFVPGTGETVQTYINEFVVKARGLSGVGTLMLLVTALLLMRTIDSSFNKIWRVETDKSLVRTLLVYWAVLTLGPILLGSSLLLTSYLGSLQLVSNLVTGYGQWLTLWLPFLMATAAFSVVLFVIPNCKIKFWHALLAGFVTACLFEVAKWGFTVFVSSFSTYQVIFGALAAVPLFLIWIYLSWGIVLLGAEFCHGLGAFQDKQYQKEQHPFIQLVAILHMLAKSQQQETHLSIDALLSEANKAGFRINPIWIEALVKQGSVLVTQEQTYCLALTAKDINYADIYKLTNNQLPDKQEIKKSQLPPEKQSDLIMISEKLQTKLSDHRVI